jgi:hypothetical protein
LTAVTVLQPPPAGLQEDAARVRRIRGPNVGLARRWFLKRSGEAGWQAFVATLSEPCRAVFSRPIGMYEWVDVEHYTEVSRAFSAFSRDHDPYRAGEVAAREELTTLNRWILRVLSPSFLISNLPRLWAFYLDGGAVHIERLEPGASELSVYAEGLVPEVLHPGLSGWLHTALGLTGVEDLRVVHTGPEPGAEGLSACRHHFGISWRPER